MPQRFSSGWRFANVLIVAHVIILLSFPSCNYADVLWKHVCEDEDPTPSSRSSRLPFCNTSLSLDERVQDYSQRVPTAQKIRMMINQAAGFPPLKIPPYNWWSEGLHGALQPCVCRSTTKIDTTKIDPDSDCRCPTSFPCPSALGNALNHTLWRRVGATIGRQARAITNLRKHRAGLAFDGLSLWTPTINLQRDPRWGRNLEVPGEDPLVVGNYAREVVKGLQYGENNDMDSSNLGKGNSIVQVAACCKHFVANSLEGNPHSVISRHNFNALLSPSDLADYYLPPFQACVEAGALGVMCSYNAVNGLPSCINAALMQDLLRHQWNFTGYVVSDCDAIDDIVAQHKFGTNISSAVALAVLAGTDLDCGIMYTGYLPQALDSGFVTPQDVDRSFQRLVRVQMQLGLFDPKNDRHHTQDDPRTTYLHYGLDDIDTAKDRQLALDAARQSIVLLQNRDNALPLRAPISKLAVIGPHIFARQAFLSSYHGERCLYGRYDCMPTPLSTMRTANQGGTTVSSIGCYVISTADRSKVDAAVKVARNADAIVLFLGIDTTVESEGKDRTKTTLPGLQLELLDRILELGITNLTVVLIHGGIVSLGQDRLNRIPALLSAPYGGQAAAQAISDVLFGTYNPTGKLVATVYPPNYVDQIPITEMGLQVGVGRTHMYYKGDAEFSFGHGLSYSQWKLEFHDKGPLHLDIRGPPLHIQLTLTNQGPFSGSQSVILMWQPSNVSSIRQKLIGYQGSPLMLQVGEKFHISFVVEPSAFAVADVTGRKYVAPGNYKLLALSAGVSTTIDLVVVEGLDLVEKIQ